MNKSRLEWKVGLFVFIGLVLLAVLLLQFSKGTTFFRPTYDILLHAASVGGLKPRAQVLMSGVQVGTVSDMQLAPDGKSVTITLRIYQPVPDSQGRPVRDRAIRLSRRPIRRHPADPATRARSSAPATRPRPKRRFDLQEVARSAAGFLQHIDSAATNINDALSDARRTVLSAQALTNLSATFDNFHRVSERSLAIVDNVNALVESNRPAITVAVSNLLLLLRADQPVRQRRARAAGHQLAGDRRGGQEHRILHRHAEKPAGRRAGGQGFGREIA